MVNDFDSLQFLTTDVITISRVSKCIKTFVIDCHPHGENKDVIFCNRGYTTWGWEIHIGRKDTCNRL